MANAGEKAMALVDGQLAAAEVPGLVRELARNAALVAELQQYLAMSQSRIAGAFAAKSAEPVPARLIDAVVRGPADGGARMRRPGLGARLRAWVSYRVPAWTLAAAPALAALAVIAVSLMIQPPGRSGLAEADLDAALETTASGMDRALATLRPMLSFDSKSAGWCRQFELRHASQQVSHALACRGESGTWKVVAATAPAPAGYRPAGAGQRKKIDDLATSMMQGEPLSRADEAAVIGRRWGRL